MITRRRTLALFAAAGTLPALAACGPNASRDTGGEEGGGALRFSWWGNPERAETTRSVIDLFTQKNPEVEISGEPADISGYFDKLATSVAAGDEPDVITMGGAYPAEYAPATCCWIWARSRTSWTCRRWTKWRAATDRSTAHRSP